MKINLQKWLAGSAAAIALAVSATALTTVSAQAQDFQLPILAELNLTADQQAQLDTLRQDTRSQVEAILTPAQIDQFFSTLQSQQNIRTAIQAADLTDTQKSQLWQVFQSSREAAAAVLTDEQQQQIRTSLQERWGDRAGNRPFRR
ncbi:MAG: hypothetical protein ACTS3T_11065 [Almyronema sp.]